MTTLSERIRPGSDAAPWVIQAIKELEQQLAAKAAEMQVSIGVGDGTGSLYVHGSYDAVKTVQTKLLELESVRRQLAAKEEELERVYGLLKGAQSRSDWGCSACELYQGVADALASPAAEPPTLADRMRAAGMLTVDEMLNGTPMDTFRKHAGVHDLETFGQWLDMQCREFLTMKARRDLVNPEGDELYEWVLAHAAVFQQVRLNFKAATAQPAPDAQQLDIEDQIREAGHE